MLIACSGEGGGGNGGGSGFTSGGSSGSAANGGSASGGGGTTFSGGSGGSLSLPDAGDAGGGTGGIDPLTGCGSNLTGTVRDFRSDHPDMQCTKQNPPYTDPANKECGTWDPQIVGAMGSLIGSDRKPVYVGGSGTRTTTGATNFDQWYRTVESVNQAQELRLDLADSGDGTFIFDTDRFFPIDNQLFAADPQDPDNGPWRDDSDTARNFHFTYELHTTFRYQQGNRFTFRGDDDVFVYIDDKLVVNIGDIHVPLIGSIDLDTGRVEVTAPLGFPDLPVSPELGLSEQIDGGLAGSVPLDLVEGEVYTMDFFFAERNTGGSNFRIETDLVFVECGVGPVK